MVQIHAQDMYLAADPYTSLAYGWIDYSPQNLGPTRVGPEEQVDTLVQSLLMESVLPSKSLVLASKCCSESRVASVSIAGPEVVSPLTPDQVEFWRARGYAAHRDHLGMIVTTPLGCRSHVKVYEASEVPPGPETAKNSNYDKTPMSQVPPSAPEPQVFPSCSFPT